MHISERDFLKEFILKNLHQVHSGFFSTLMKLFTNTKLKECLVLRMEQHVALILKC